MAGYYRKFCRNFSDQAAPLTRLLKKENRFRWSDECQTAFENIKTMLSNKPVLKAPDFEQPFCLGVDASETGIGAVMIQADDQKNLHPVSYFSRKLNSFQKSYSAREKELLALLLSVQHFEIYLTASVSPTVVFTDHNPLIYLQLMKKKN